MSVIRGFEDEARAKPSVSSVEDLDVFRRAYAISLDLHQVSLKFPKIEQFGGLADQIRRASKSICANLAEGFGKQRQSNLEFKRYLLRLVLPMRCKSGCDIARISNTSIRKQAHGGGTSTVRLRACCKA
jgi:hypothetical protein